MGDVAKGSSSSTAQNVGDFEVIAAVLRSYPGIDAVRISAIATANFGPAWDKKRVNGVVYRMETAGLVVKVLQGAKPVWQLKS